MVLRALVLLTYYAICLSTARPQSSRAPERPDRSQTLETRGDIEFWFIPRTEGHVHPKESLANAKRQDWYDWFWPPTWSNWALVIIGGFAACAAFRTLDVIKKQTKATQVAANAANTTAQAVLLAERAWLQIEIAPEFQAVFGLRFNVANHGRTPGFVTKLEYGYRKFKTQLTEWPPIVPHTQVWESGDMIPSNKISRMYFAKLETTGLITESEVSAARDGTLFLVFIARVFYKDTFGENRETWCCQNFIPDKGWFLHGSDRMNGRT